MLYYIFMKVLFMSLAAGIVAGVIWMATSLKRLKISNAGRYYLWLCVLLVMVLPIRIPVQKMVFVSETRDQNNTAITASADAPDPVQPRAVLFAAEKSENEVQLPPVLAAAPKPQARTVSTAPQQDAKNLVKEWIPLLWAGGAFLLILRYIVEKILLKRKLACFSVPAPEITKAVFQEAMEQTGVGRNIHIRGLRVPASPFMTGIFRNIIYVPAGLPEEELRLILRHELTHCRRFDLLYRAAAEVIGAVHFFNPLVYIIKRKIEMYCELSCDDRAIKNMTPAEKKTYSMAMLKIASRNMTHFNTTAALCEKQTHLKERIESIMINREHSTRTRALTALTVIMIMLFSTVTSGVINAQNGAAAPKATYVSENFNNISITPVPDESNLSVNVYDNPVMTYTDFLGRNTFIFTFIGMSDEKAAQYRTLLEQDDYEAATELYQDPQNYTDFYTVELTKIQEKYGSYTKNIKGFFKITRNDEVWAENAEGYITNLPPVTAGFETNLFTELTAAFTRNGQQYILHTNGRFEEVTGEQALHNRKVRNDYKRSRDTRRIALGRVEQIICEGSEVNPGFINDHLIDASSEWSFNPSLGQAQIYVPISKNQVLSLPVPAPAKCSDDTLQAEFLYRKSIVPSDDGNYISLPRVTPYAVVQCTVSGLSNPVGGYVEVKSDDGRFYYKAQIVEEPKDELPCYGTRRPEEFYTQGEDVFVGTPAQQDDFDRDEHDKFYKRIVTDDNGYVLFVVPVEYQTGQIVKDAEERLRAQVPGEVIRRGESWTQLLYSCLNQGNTAVLLDPVTWWCKAVVPPENRYFTITNGENADNVIFVMHN